jgi:acetolactate synthase-1/2/3 large subunit
MARGFLLSWKDTDVNGARAALEACKREGAEAIFGYPGGTIMPFYDAMFGDPEIRHYLVRHEAAAVFAASGYARTTGRVGLCCATSGPGATNLVTGLLDALMDSVPLVAITGQVRSDLMGTDGFQEADVCSITQPVTKYNVLVRHPGDIPAAIAEAFALARSGRPGPVLVDIPTDVLKAAMPENPRPVRRQSVHATATVDRSSVARAVELLRAAQRPVLIAGGGVRGTAAVKAFRRFAALAGAPQTTTINGLGAATPGDWRDLGMLGMHGTKAANVAVHESDLVFALGMRFDDRVTGRTDRFARGAKIVHADIDPSEFDKIIRADVTLPGDITASLEALAEELERYPALQLDGWAQSAADRAAVLPCDRLAAHTLSATTVLDRFFALMPANAVVTTDVGQHQMWDAQRIRPSEPRAFATSAGLGAMGFGFPAAVGAQVAHPDRPVFAIVGDGGFQMSLPELATLKRHGLPVKIVLIDNRNLGMVRQWQELFYDERYSATNLSDNPDFAAIATAYGIRSETVEALDDLDAAIGRLISIPGAALLHCACYPAENVWPMIPGGGSIDDVMTARAPVPA